MIGTHCVFNQVKVIEPRPEMWDKTVSVTDSFRSVKCPGHFTLDTRTDTVNLYGLEMDRAVRQRYQFSVQWNTVYNQHIQMV